MLALVAAVAAAAPSALSGPQATRIVYRPVDPPTDLGPTRGSCPYGRQRSAIVSPSGQRLGTSLWCIKNREEIQVPPIRARETVVVTDTFARGTIVSNATFIYTFAKPNQGPTFSAAGNVRRGTGRYKGRKGTFRGSGRLVYGPGDRVSRRITFTITLS